jgi:predicted dehydrogenase
MNARPLCGVLIGHGRMGQLHASKLANRPDVSLSIIDPMQGLNPALPERIDFAVIATPSSTHRDVALPWLERGVPCLIEKPLSCSLREAEQLARFDHVSVGHIERFNPVFSAGQWERPGFIDIERLAPHSARSMDIDVIDDLMIHDLDLLLSTAPGRVLNVTATGMGVASDKPDIVNARLEFDADSAAPLTVNITASRVSEKAVRSWRVVENGTYWSLDLLHRSAKRVDWSDGQLVPQSIDVPKWDPLTRQHTAFLDSVRGQICICARGEEAVAALRLGERIRACLH